MPILGGCCCFDLKVGTKIIGVLSLLSSIAGFLTTVCSLIVIVFMKDMVLSLLEHSSRAAHDSSFGITSSAGISPSNNIIDDDYQTTDDEVDYIISVIKENMEPVKIACIILVCLSLIGITASSCLIHGIRTNRRGLLLPWILLVSLWLLAAIGFAILFFVIIGFNLISGISALIILVGVGIDLYLLLVVISQYQAFSTIMRMHHDDEMPMK